MHGLLNVKFKVAITETYPRIPWELVADPSDARNTLWEPLLYLIRMSGLGILIGYLEWIS